MKNDKNKESEDILTELFGEYYQIISTKMLDKVELQNRNKVKIAIDDFLTNSGSMTSPAYFERFLQSDNQIDYIEFHSCQEAKDYLIKSNKILNILYLFGKEMRKENTLSDLAQLYKTIENNAATESIEILSNSTSFFSDENGKLLRFIIQFA